MSSYLPKFHSVYPTGSEKPQLKDRGCDNVLPDQDCRTLQGVVIDECEAVVE
jgi:hypothetical protein